MRLDLHTHSYFSDGEYPPEKIKAEATKRRVSFFSITDHNILWDTKSIKENITENDRSYIDGLEISTLHLTSRPTLSLHILCYGKAFYRNILNKGLRQTIDGYNSRAHAITSKLNNIFPDIELNFESIKNNGHEIYVSRNTLAKLVVEHLKGTLPLREVLKQFVFIENENDDWMMTPKESFELIARAGGIPVLAHSGRELRKLGMSEYKKMIEDLAGDGLRGIEVYYPKHTKEDIATLRSVAKNLGLYITGGSDWHGNMYTPETEIGQNIPNEDITPFLEDKRIMSG